MHSALTALCEQFARHAEKHSALFGRDVEKEMVEQRPTPHLTRCEGSPPTALQAGAGRNEQRKTGVYRHANTAKTEKRREEERGMEKGARRGNDRGSERPEQGIPASHTLSDSAAQCSHRDSSRQGCCPMPHRATHHNRNIDRKGSVQSAEQGKSAEQGTVKTQQCARWPTQATVKTQHRQQ